MKMVGKHSQRRSCTCRKRTTDAEDTDGRHRWGTTTKKHHVDDTRMFPAGGLRAHHRWQCPQRRMPAWVNMPPDETWLPFTSTKRHFSPGRGGNRTEPENISSNAWHRSSFERASDHSTSELPSIPRSPPQPTQRRPPQRQHARIRLKSQCKTKNISFPGRLLNRHCLPFGLPLSLIHI